MSKLLTVFGATGQQGGSLITYILNHPTLSKLYHLRGITRDGSKKASLDLKNLGVEMIQADLNDPSSLIPAVSGSYAVFGVTNFWDSASAPTETAQGKAIADACLSTSTTLLIWSSLPNLSRLSNGTLKSIPHFDSKAAVETYIRTLPIQSAFFMAGWYMQNHLVYMRPKIMGDGTIVLSQTWSPTAQIPMIDITDTGKFIASILLNPTSYAGKSFTCATAYYTPLELCSTWSKVTGKKVIYRQVESAIANENLMDEMKEGLKGKDRVTEVEFSYFGPTGRKYLEWTLEQMIGNEKPTTWEEFVRKNEPWFETSN